MRKNNKKADVWNIFVFVIITVALLIIIMLMIKYFDEVKAKENRFNILNFYSEFQKDIETTRDNYGNVKYKQYFISDDYKKVCFSEYGMATSDGITISEIKDIIDDKIPKNVFIVSKKSIETNYINGIIIENLSSTKFGCFNLTEGYVVLRLEARVTGTVVGPPYYAKNITECVILVPDMMGKSELEPKKWNLTEKYFKNDTEGKIKQACGLSGWESVKIVQ